MKILTESDSDWLYMKLHMFKRGLVTSDELKHSDDLIYTVRDNGIITIKFENDEQYFKLFDLSQDDVWFLNNLFSHYGGSIEFFDSYRGEDDWDEGHILRYFNDENTELAHELKNILAPHVNLDDNPKEFLKILKDTFNNQVDYIIGDYVSELDSAMSNAMEKEIKEELCDIFMSDGIFTVSGCFYKYTTTVDTLIKLYDQYNSKTSNLITLLKRIGHEKSVDGGYYESMYDYMYGVDLDKVQFNSYVKHQLESIMSDLEDSDKFPDIEGYKNVLDYVSEKFKLNKWNPLPKDKTINFKIIRVNNENNEIEFEYTKNGIFKKGMLDLEKFNTFLYHPELFSLFD
jgi:hypothetical protein